MKKENDRKILAVILEVLSRHEGKVNAIKRAYPEQGQMELF